MLISEHVRNRHGLQLSDYERVARSTKKKEDQEFVDVEALKAEVAAMPAPIPPAKM